MSGTHPNSQPKRILTWAPNFDRPGGRWKKQIDGKVRFFGHADSREDSKAYKAALDSYLDFLQRRKKQAPVEVPISKATVKQVCEKLVQRDQERYERGEITACAVNRTRACLDFFIKFVGARKPFAQVTEMTLEDFRTRMLRQTDPQQVKHPIKPATAKARLGAVKKLFRWAFKMRLCEMPRNLDTYAKVRIVEPKVELFTLEEIRTLWNEADERMRCYMALGLNCGFYQKDISDLKMDEVDWDKGYITRERGKTRIKATYKLWPMTLELMKAHRNAGDTECDRVFVNCYGRPLLSETFEDGKLKRSDATKSLFWRLLLSLGLAGNHRGFSTLRNTAATEIEKIDPAVTEMFLSHSEKGMKKHYAERDWKRLHAAQERLEKVLGLTKATTEAEKPVEPIAEGSWAA